MARKVIIDCDPGIDDAVALCIALFEPKIEVVALTAVAGNVSADQASRNVHAIVEQLDPPRLPRLGVASPPECGTNADARHIHGEDGLGNSGFEVSELHHQHPSEKMICDEVRAAANDVTLVCLGPLTNVAHAFRRDPELPASVDRLIIMGGSVSGIGNATPSAEFNIYCDPQSAREVFQSPTTKTLIPLDVTRQVNFNLDFLDSLPRDTTRAGSLLRRIVPHLFRTYHQRLGQESIHLHDAVVITALVHSELFVTEEMAGDVETSGNLTTGSTIFDRRSNQQWRNNMEVATEVDAAAVRDSIMRGLSHSGDCS